MNADKQLGKWTHGLLLWTILNTIGWGLFVALALPIASLVWELYDRMGYRLLHNEVIRGIVGFAIAGLCLGAIVGGLQQFVLKRRFELEGSKWVLATTVGLTLHAVLEGVASVGVAILSYSALSSYISYGISALVPPLALGIAQWYVLRQYFARSGWWIAATVLALWLPTTVLPIFIGRHALDISFFLVLFLVKGFAYGVLTWIALAVIARQPFAAAESE